MVNRIKHWFKHISMRKAIVCTTILILVSTFLVYYFSFDAKAHVLVCTGNYYLTDSQIYELANVSTDTRVRFIPSRVLEQRIEQMPLVESVEVTKSRGRLMFHIQEKTVVGYYVRKNKNYMLTADNESIPLDRKYMKLLIHFPLLNGFSVTQRKKICKEFKKHKKKLGRSIIEKIAEMVPYKTSFDENMIQMTMQDGNMVYTSLNSLFMMANYQAMLTKLQGENVCLFLDANNSAIEKISCEDINSSEEETQTEEQEETSQQQTATQEDEWVMDPQTGLEYNANSGYYRDPSTLEEYIWNEQTQTFDAVTSSNQSTVQDSYSSYAVQ